MNRRATVLAYSTVLLTLLGCAGETTPPVASPVAERPSLPTPLGSVALEVDGEHPLDPRKPLVLGIRGEGASRLAQTMAPYGEVSNVTSDAFVVRWDYIGAAHTALAGPEHLASSFVIDHEEASVQAVADQVIGLHGQDPTAQQLTDFVSKHMTTPEYGRFDIASRVANRKSGDCTEHAVLLTALARHFGKPARVVLGYVLLPDLGFAMGHAWSELHDGQRWSPYDAARREEPVDNRYVLAGYFDHEGPGYAFHNPVVSHHVSSVTIHSGP